MSLLRGKEIHSFESIFNAIRLACIENEEVNSWIRYLQGNPFWFRRFYGFGSDLLTSSTSMSIENPYSWLSHKTRGIHLNRSHAESWNLMENWALKPRPALNHLSKLVMNWIRINKMKIKLNFWSAMFYLFSINRWNGAQRIKYAVEPFRIQAFTFRMNIVHIIIK